MTTMELSKGKVKFVTLGCRLNQYESQAVREQFLSNGYAEAGENETADVFVINTCTVTSDSDKDSRYYIRKCHRENPNAKIMVTGCYVERDHEAAASIPGVTHVVFNRFKSDIVSLLEGCATLSADEAPFKSKAEFTPLSISEFLGKTRAHIKIQDGCNHACSFCKVVLVRGKSRSRALSDIVEEAKRLVENGYQEVVLTGIQLGAYGLDLNPQIRLEHVIQALAKIHDLKRIRLSSIEPVDVTSRLIEIMKHEPKACHHLHIPLQSGSEHVLQTMNRRYGKKEYLGLVQKLNENLSDFILTMDVMVGFPTETDEHFLETIETIISAKPYKLHIFPYSAREGTRAFALKSLPKHVINERMNALYQLEKKLKREVMNVYIGRKMRVLFEESAGKDWQEARTDNFMVVRMHKNPAYQAGDLREVEILGVEDDELIGTVKTV